MPRSKRLLWLALPITPLVIASVVALFGFWQAERTLTRSTQTATTQRLLKFSLRTLDLTASQPIAFEPLAAANDFSSGAFFHGNLYLAGPGGLSIYSPDGTLRRQLRTGLELPVDPIVHMATGQLRGATDPQLLLATAGAGVLILESNSDSNPSGTPVLHQLEPASSDFRDLTTLLPLPSGDLLLGTRHHGVLLYTGTTLTPLTFNSSGVDPATLQVTALAAADASSYFIGTRNTGLFYLHAGTVQHSDAASGMPDQQVDAILIAGNKAFAGTPLGVAQFDLDSTDAAQGDAAAEALHPTHILAQGTFSHALTLSASQLLIGSLDQGVVPLQLATRPHLRNASITPPGRTSDLGSSSQRVDQFLASPSEESLLFALIDGSLHVKGSAGWEAALPPDQSATLTDRNISALAFDPQGRLYVGFFDRGLDIVSPDSTTPRRHLEDDHLFCVNRLVLDPQRGTIAAATANGVVLFDRQAIPRQILTHRDGLISDHITDIAFTRTGTTLATPAGLTFITPSGTDSLYAFQGLVNNHVYTLAAQQGSDRLLAGTLGGLSILQSGSVTRNFTATNSGLKHNWITALATMPDGSSLIGTYGAGIQRLSSAADGSPTFTPIDLPAAAPRDLVINPNAMLVTATHVFAGTLGHGMLVYTIASARWSLIASGLPSLNVTAFAQRNGELYIGTENGLVRISEQALGSALP